jgi:hypothetical protein
MIFKTGLLALAVLASPVSAATMQAVYRGTVSGGYDETGVFGAGGGDLAGLAFTLTYIYDTSVGNRDSGYHDDWMGSWFYDELRGGTAYGVPSPILSATLELAGKPDFVDFGGVTQAEITTRSDGATYTNYHHRAQSTGYGDDAENGSFVYGFTVNNWLSAPVGSSANLDDPSSLLTGPMDFSGDFDIYAFSYTNGNYFLRAQGTLDEDTLEISELVIPAPVPLPASFGALLTGLVAVGMLRRKKRYA